MSPAPYQVTHSKTSNDFYFITDSGVTYNIYFDSSYPLLPNEFLDRYSLFMGFRCNPPDGNGYDPRVGPTITLIIGNILKSNKRYIITYFCSGQGGHERARSILFERWYRNSPLVEKIAHKQKKNVNNYFGALYSKKHPELEAIESTFYEFDLSQKYPEETEVHEEIENGEEDNFESDFLFS